MIALKDGIRSLVRIDFQGRVHKHFRGTGATERCANEIHVLKVLEERGCPNVPRLLDSDPEENYIVTTNCGKSAEPTITKAKSDALFKELEEQYGIRHDDPEPRNVTYDQRMGRFCLIDFELATVLEISEAPSTHIDRAQWAAGSNQGRRHLTNQDSFLCFKQNSKGAIFSAEQGEAILPLPLTFFAVSDGVGGNRGGEFASSLVLSTMKHLLLEKGNNVVKEEEVEYLLQETHENLNKKAQQNAHAAQLSATFAGIILQGESLIWANVGDSRVYRWRDGELSQLSRDHNFAFRQWKRGEISEMQYRMHPRRNVLFDSMGGGHQRISPELGLEQWKSGDLYLICSDGIIDGLSDGKIKYFLKEDLSLESGETKAQLLLSKLKEEAVKNDGSDDTTLIVVEIN